MLTSGFSNLGTGGSGNFASQQERDLGSQIQQVRNQAAPGTAVSVDTTYEVDQGGRLIPVQAVVRSSQIDRQAPQDTSLPAGSQSLTSAAIKQSEAASTTRLSAEAQKIVDELQSRDLEVRIEEAQHFRASGGLASGGVDLQFTQGPDGQFYAVGGAVNIQATATDDPEQAARDAQTFALAATAPATAGAQDFSVARSAAQQAAGHFHEAIRNLSDNSADPTALPQADENDDPFAAIDIAV